MKLNIMTWNTSIYLEENKRIIDKPAPQTLRVLEYVKAFLDDKNNENLIVHSDITLSDHYPVTFDLEI